MASAPFFASSSVARHLVRGAVGLLLVVAAVLGAALGVSAALVLLVPAVIAWRGCPTCWAVGLTQTRERCADGACGRPSAG